MMANKHDQIILAGLDGINPLGFLASVGVAIVANDVYSKMRIGWRRLDVGWRPVIIGCGHDNKEFAEKIYKILQSKNYTMDIFTKNELPFEINDFINLLKKFCHESSLNSRRSVDLISGLGTDLAEKGKEGKFQDTKFRFVRSADAAGQGFLSYAKKNRGAISFDHVYKTLFKMWDYSDEKYSLRLDPIEDQRYAQSWNNPSKEKITHTMLTANDLAVEALRLFPVIPTGKKSYTVGFQQNSFIWPLWEPMISLDVMRSVISLSLTSNQKMLLRMGIKRIFVSRRVWQSKYYTNFTIAEPLVPYNKNSAP